MKKHLILSVGCGMLTILTPGHSRGAGRQFVQGHIPAAVSKLSPSGSLPASNTLALAMGLPLRNTNELTALVRAIYDPASPQYHQYLTPDQFAARFGPTEQDYQAVRAYAEANGLRVYRGYRGGLQGDMPRSRRVPRSATVSSLAEAEA